MKETILLQCSYIYGHVIPLPVKPGTSWVLRGCRTQQKALEVA